MRKLVNFQEQQIEQHKGEEVQFFKDSEKIISEMEEKKRLRDEAIIKVQKVIDKKNKLDQRVAEVEENRN
jgi:hypothetical protein